MPRTSRARPRRLGRERLPDAERVGQPPERSDEAGVEAYARACREEAAERLILTALGRRRASPE